LLIAAFLSISWADSWSSGFGSWITSCLVNLVHCYTVVAETL
jgi:hypothetical protein